MIEIRKLTKKYDKFTAVDNIDLVAEDGKITVLLGPNGAGKSTTIKSIAGLLKHTGTIEIDGHLNTSIEAKRIFGYIPEAPTLYETLTIDEHIQFIAKAYKVQNYEEIADHLIKVFELEDKRKTVVRKLSKGMSQKVSMLLALIPQPHSLMIDEPMIGLDPTAIENVLKLLEELKAAGCSILISTHIIDVIDELWDVAYIMVKGKLVKKVERADLREKTLKEIFFECVEGEAE